MKDDKVIFAEGTDVTSAVRNKCELDNKFTKFLDEYISKQGFTVLKAGSKKAKGITKRLHVEIGRDCVAGGGEWTGGKMVHAVGTLTENGEVIGSLKVLPEALHLALLKKLVRYWDVT